MKIRVSEKEKRAMVRFKHPMEIEWFKRTMASIRDSDTKTHPPIVLKDDNNKVIHFPPPTPMPPPVSGEHVVVEKASSIQSIPPPDIKMKPIVVKKEDMDAKK